MSRAPFVMPKATSAFSRANAVYDTTIGWRFVNPKMEASYGAESMPQTADNVAADFGVNRADQDAFAVRSQERWAAAQVAGRFADETVPVSVSRRQADSIIVDSDEHPRPGTTMETLSKLRGVNGPGHDSYRRQRKRRQRWRGGAAHCEPSGRGGARFATVSPDRWDEFGWSRTTSHGDRPIGCQQEGTATRWP